MVTDVEAANKAVVERLIEEVVNGRRYDVAAEVIAEEYVRHEPNVPAEPARPEEFASMVESLHEAFPDLEMAIDGLIAEDDLVSFYATERGTHEGEFMGLEPTGASFEITGNVTHRLEGGTIAETWATFDWLSLLRQLGVVPAHFDQD